MSNDKDFKVKNGIQPTAYYEAVGTVVSESEINAYDLSSASYDSKSFDPTTELSGVNPANIYVSNDGTKLFVMAFGDIYQYTMNTAHDVSTASYDSKTYDFSSQASGTVSGLFFKPDGTKFYITDRGTGLDVYQYDLSTAWDISTASYNTKTYSPSEDSFIRDIFIKPDGAKMYLLGDQNNSVFQYSLSTAWDISTASYDSKTSVLSPVADYNMYFSSDGEYLLTLAATEIVYRYPLTTAWDASPIQASDQNFSVSSQDIYAAGISFSNSGQTMYYIGVNTDFVYQYSVSTTTYTNTLDLSTGSVFESTPTSDIEFGLSNPADSGTVSQATLLLDGSAATITYASNIEWPGGTAPTSPAIGETGVITFSTRDGGTTYQAAVAIDGAK